MLNAFVRAIVIYIFVLIVMRLMGKREIGQLQPFELVIAMMIADLAAIPLTANGVPLFRGIISILGLLVMHLLISVINMKSIILRGIISGKPKILIYRGKIDEQALIKERITINELQEKLRSNSVMSLGDVEFAILETSGDLSVIQKPSKRNVTPEDLNIEPEYEGIPYDLVVDTKIQYENLKKLGKDYKWLEKEVKKFGYTPNEALIVTTDGKGAIFCQKKEK